MLLLALFNPTCQLDAAAVEERTQYLTNSAEVPKGLGASEWSSIRAAYTANRHAAFPVAGGHQARNPGQQWRTEFDGRGFTTRPDSGGWQWGLELRSYGFSGQERAVAQQAYVKASNTDCTAVLGFFGKSVAVSGDTVVVGATFENSSATGVNGNQSDNSAPASGAAYVFVRSAGVWTQQALSECTFTNAGAAYVFVRSAGLWSQQAYLKASNAELGDGFGDPVAVSGDRIVVGAIGESSMATGVNGNQSANSDSNSGAVYVFLRNGTTWNHEAYLKASTTQPADSIFNGSFGHSVGVSGDTVVVGAAFDSSGATGVNATRTTTTPHCPAQPIYLCATVVGGVSRLI